MNMNSDLQDTAQGYIGLLAGALAFRAKAAPTQQQNYEPLTTAMTRLALCLRKQGTTERDMIIAIRNASSVWSEWQEQYCHFWERLAKSELEYLEQGDVLAEINQLIGV
jgi:hypothetical protein